MTKFEVIGLENAWDMGNASWFAVYTLSCQEKRVARHFEFNSIEHFLPITRSTRRWKNGCTVMIEQPLFPGYVFVKIQRSRRVRVLELPGVHSIIGAGKDPIALPEFEMETLRRGLDSLKVEPCPYLNIGEKAVVLRGPLEGMTGVVVRKKNGLRFVLSLDLIAKSVAVEIDAADLEPTGSHSRWNAAGASSAKKSSSVLEVCS